MKRSLLFSASCVALLALMPACHNPKKACEPCHEERDCNTCHEVDARGVRVKELAEIHPVTIDPVEFADNDADLEDGREHTEYDALA